MFLFPFGVVYIHYTDSNRAVNKNRQYIDINWGLPRSARRHEQSRYNPTRPTKIDRARGCLQ